VCEFEVIVNGNIVFEDAIYAKADGDKVIVEDILGDSREFNNYRITEVNMKTTRVILSELEQ